MNISRHIHQQIRLKNALLTFVIIVLLICLAWLSRVYNAQIDLTANASNTLTEASQKILKTVPEDITVTAYIKEPVLRKQVADLLNRYRRFKQNIDITFIDPTSVPEKSRELNIGIQGAIIVEYQGRSEKIHYLDESSFSNALLQLASSEQHWITFLEGHGERSPSGIANFDLGLFGDDLERRKIRSQSINLAQISSIPDNSSLLVLTTPAVPLLPAELTVLTDYIEQGGNLLLLTDPDNTYLTSLESLLGLSKLPGTVVDSSTSLYGVDDPSFTLISKYTAHPITIGFNNITVFPVTAALDFDQESEFDGVSLLTTVKNSWTESSEINGKIRFDIDSDEQQGPLNIAYAITRDFADKKQQRIVVIGDGDFLSNAYLGNVGNSELGFRIINWLTHNDQFIEIPSKMTPGKSLQLSKPAIAIMGFGFLLVFPCLLLFTGILIWRKRKRR